MADIDYDQTRQAAARRRPRHILTVAITTSVVLVLLGATVALARNPDRHTIQFRIEGSGIAHIARVWDSTGAHDLMEWGVVVHIESPQAALFVIAASTSWTEDGTGEPASCVILLDGAEVARAEAEPLTNATCAWARTG